MKRFEALAHRFPHGSIGENFFHLLSEVEVVFGLWAGVFIAIIFALNGPGAPITYLESLNFTEPAFVFAIMTMAATVPVLFAAGFVIELLARVLTRIVSPVFPLPRSVAFFVVLLIVGPLLGSFITEPAAMTVTAMLLLDHFFKDTRLSKRFRYLTIGTLFVNISIGGTLTNFAAPPVLMVAERWGWSSAFMFTHFGWRATLAVVIITLIIAILFSKELRQLDDHGSVVAKLKRSWLQQLLLWPLRVMMVLINLVSLPWLLFVELRNMRYQNTVEKDHLTEMHVPWWMVGVHLGFIGAVVFYSHHMAVFLPLFLFFLGVMKVTAEYQEAPKLQQSLLVAFFLGGLVTLGGMQAWWLKPLLASLGDTELFFGTTTLTAVTDNAALTYLGSLVEGLSDQTKYALVAGAVTGGGLTVIANAPNPAGYGILKDSFGEKGISPLGLLAGALPATMVAIICFWVL